MTVKVLYASSIARSVGIHEEVVPLAEASSVHNLLKILAEKHGDSLRKALFDTEGKLLPAVMVARNGEQLQDVSSQQVDDNDEVMLLSAISGG